MKKFFKDNGLSIAFFVLFIVSIFAQAATGLKEHNQETLENGGPQVNFLQYLNTGHFVQATFEN